MGKIREILINRFDGGMAFDLREDIPNKYGLAKHFKAFEYKNKLVPNYQRLMDWSGDPANLGIVKVLYATFLTGTAESGLLFGFSLAGTNNYPKIYKLDIDSGLPGTWTACTNGISDNTNDARNLDVFFHYKGYIYLWTVNKLDRFKVTDDEAYDSAYYDPSAAVYSVAQPVHHPSDDNAYFFHANFVHELDNVTWDDKKLTLPSTERITAACAYGDYLAIATVNNLRPYQELIGEKSTVYLWDRDGSLETISQKIDFGSGEIMHLTVLDNKLTAVMNSAAAETLGIDNGKIIIKQYLNYVEIVNEVLVDNNIATWTGGSAAVGAGSDYYLPRTNIKKDEKLYFPMRADLNGESRNGIWSLNSDGALGLEIVDAELNDTTAKNYRGVYCTGNIWWTMYALNATLSGSNTSQNIYYTDDSKVFYTSTPSTYESLIFDIGDRTKTKKLLGTTVTTEALSAAGRIVLEYRVDSDLDDATAWTEIFDNTTNDSIRQSAILNSDSTVFSQFKEIQFRIKSYGGAVITGLKFKTETIDNDVY